MMRACAAGVSRHARMAAADSLPVPAALCSDHVARGALIGETTP